MKANELMIGDWVYSIFSEHPCKVKGIEWTESEYAYVNISGVDGYKCIESLSPIPLTPEILEKNGWKHEFDKKDYMVKYNLGEEGKNCWMMWAIKEHNLDIQRQDVNLDVYNLKVSKVAIPCDYVHELQHALRLCGIEKEIIL